MFFDEFSIGQKFEVNSVTLSLEEIEEFARRYDPQPIHIDHEFAEQGPFKGIIASGFQTLSVIWAEWIKSERFGTEIIGGTGLDFVTWDRPVRPGDTLHTVAEVTETIPSQKGNRGLVVLKFTVTNQTGKTVLTTQGRVYLKSSASEA